MFLLGACAEVDGDRRPALLTQTVGDAAAQARVVEGDGEARVAAQFGGDTSGGLHERGATILLLSHDDPVLDPGQGGGVGAEAGDVDAERAALGGAGGVFADGVVEQRQGEELVRRRAGELGQHA